MAQEPLVVFVDVILQHRVGLCRFGAHHLAEACDDLFEERLIEHISPAVHDQHHVVALQQIAGLQYDTVGACCQHLHPQALVEHFTREDKHA